MFGDRSTKTGKQLWNKIKNKKIHQVATDYWKPYGEFVPKEIHLQSKAETYTVEGYNSLLRHFLARLRRKSKCYTKSISMLRHSVVLFMIKRDDGIEAIFN